MLKTKRCMYRADTQQTCKHWNHESSSSNKETAQAKTTKLNARVTITTKLVNAPFSWYSESFVESYLSRYDLLPKISKWVTWPDYAPFGANLSCLDWHLPGSIHFYRASYASEVLGVVILSVCPSAIILVFWCQRSQRNSNGVTPNGGRQREVGVG